LRALRSPKIALESLACAVQVMRLSLAEVYTLAN
jgi:hypothetical protein